jgi:hypothetical protein
MTDLLSLVKTYLSSSRDRELALTQINDILEDNKQERIPPVTVYYLVYEINSGRFDVGDITERSFNTAMEAYSFVDGLASGIAVKVTDLDIIFSIDSKRDLLQIMAGVIQDAAM